MNHFNIPAGSATLAETLLGARGLPGAAAAGKRNPDFYRQKDYTTTLC